MYIKYVRIYPVAPVVKSTSLAINVLTVKLEFESRCSSTMRNLFSLRVSMESAQFVSVCVWV